MSAFPFPFRLALLSDLHANLHALQACLAHARARQVGRWAFLGDLVGYGADPAAVVDAVMGLAAEGAWVVLGNHDAMAVHPPAQDAARDASLGSAGARWTHGQLGADRRAFLDGLPLTRQVDGMLLVHATADDPARWHYADNAAMAARSLEAALAQPEVRWVFGGHVHQQSLYYRGADARLLPFAPTPGVPVPVPAHRRWLATVGSVGQPRDGDPRAMYAIFDGERAEITFHRVPYDHHAAADAIRRAGLPEAFASRLEAGR